METLDQHILAHIARYHVTVRPVLSLFVADIGTAAATIGRLARRHMVLAQKGLPGNRSFYRLTRKGTAVAGVSEARARPLKAAAMFKHLGILMFCHVEGSGRYRLGPPDR